MGAGAARSRERVPVYLVTTRVGAERSTSDRLKRSGVRAYAPRVLVGQREEALFPGYLFVWVTDQWLQVRRTEGVIEFVMMGDRPIPVPQVIVEAIRASESEYGYVTFGPKFRVGQSVRLVDHLGSVGIVVGQAPRQRVRVLLALLGRRIELTLPEEGLLAA